MRKQLPSCGHTQLKQKCSDCLALQAKWYGILEQSGFTEIENEKGGLYSFTSHPHGLFGPRTATRAEHREDQFIDSIQSQSPDEPLISSFPGSYQTDKERLLLHPHFDGLCQSICNHGNHQLVPAQVRSIWELHIEGGSVRIVGARLQIQYTLVWRTIRTILQWMELMDLEAEEQDHSIMKVVLRAFKPMEDEQIIYGTWRNALWYDDDKQRHEGDAGRFYSEATHSIRKILKNPATKVRIACLSNDPGIIIGYSVITGNCLHFVYVKADYRNKRIGSMLVPLSVETCSPVMTKIGRAIAVKRGFIKNNKENPDVETEGQEE